MKLIAVDMDGTLLDDQKKYNKELFRTVYEEMSKQGIVYAVASGNQYYQLRTFFEGYDDLYYVAENGSLVMHKDEVIEKNTFSEMEVVLILEELLKHKDLVVCVCGVKSAYLLKANNEHYTRFHQFYEHLELVDSFDEFDDQIMKFTAYYEGDAYEYLPNCEDIPFVVTTVAGDHYLDFTMEDVSKASGLRAICRKLNISLEDCIAFGDSDNDVEMLDKCGDSFAMENCSDKARKTAKHQIGSNNADSVLLTIKDLLHI